MVKIRPSGFLLIRPSGFGRMGKSPNYYKFFWIIIIHNLLQPMINLFPKLSFVKLVYLIHCQICHYLSSWKKKLLDLSKPVFSNLTVGIWITDLSEITIQKHTTYSMVFKWFCWWGFICHLQVVSHGTIAFVAFHGIIEHDANAN